jgi:hypothetical protein
LVERKFGFDETELSTLDGIGFAESGALKFDEIEADDVHVPPTPANTLEPTPKVTMPLQPVMLSFSTETDPETLLPNPVEYDPFAVFVPEVKECCSPKPPPRPNVPSM